MLSLYSFFSALAWQIVKLLALWKPKLKKFVHGRNESFKKLQNQIDTSKPLLWVHTASLGEYEQGLPIIEELKKQYLEHQILVSFFSPSGYDVMDQSKDADIFVYLPWDSPRKVKEFLALTNPQLAIFVKYEFWPNYLQQIYKQQIPCILVSALFREKHSFFKWYGGFMRKHLRAFDHFFVQDQHSKYLLHNIGIDRVTIAGDTRFDRVIERKEKAQDLDFIKKFKANKKLVVFGSSWPEDEKWFIPWVNQQENYKILIAPHEIKEKNISRLLKKISSKSYLCYTNMHKNTSLNKDIFVLDTIGLLAAAYAYADLVFVGGGVGDTGLHNTLEAAVFGVPIIIGPKYTHFKEAEDLVGLGGIYAAQDAKDLHKQLDFLLENPKPYLHMSEINRKYIESHAGATEKIMKYIESKKYLF